jgi:alpha-amylase/alpha-mannosidase (GH57 family)
LINFCFGIHNHQPVGNFDNVIEAAYERCYFPFVKLLVEYPSIKVTLHNSGVLWDWFEQRHPEYFEYIERLLAAGQLELLSGAYYEPILPAIFDSHKAGQIEKLSAYLKKRFSVEARGLWLAERVWEPPLAGILHDCGIEYTILDDTHFRWAGIPEKNLDGYFITEEQNKKLALFPISKGLRYAIPFEAPGKSLAIFKRLAKDSPGRMAIYADDGEKFGVWPDTYKLCYEQKWLARFFDQLTKNSDWLKIRFFSEALKTSESNGRIYLPTASYAEMGQWSLPSDGFNHYEELENKLKENGQWETYGYLVKGGFWRNFLSKYPEANNMHKKMYYVASKIEKTGRRISPAKKRKLAKARDLLFQGQCNCPYWHGVFGGLYLNHLRYATYNRFIQAEKIIDKLDNLPAAGRIVTTDFDADGHDEILAETRRLGVYFSPRYGGMMFELDLKDFGFNILDTLSRHREGYHKKLSATQNPSSSTGKTIHERFEAKEKGLEKYLIYDWHRRASFIDHVMPLDTNFEHFRQNSYRELGDFILEPFLCESKRTRRGLSLTFSREGHIFNDKNPKKLTVFKTISIDPDQAAIESDYSLLNNSDANLEFLFGVEFNWSMLAKDGPARYYYVNGSKLADFEMLSRGESREVQAFGIRDGYHKLDINISLSQAGRLWRFPIETVSLSEQGFERGYQSSVTCPVFDIKISPKESYQFKMALRFIKTKA